MSVLTKDKGPDEMLTSRILLVETGSFDSVNLAQQSLIDHPLRSSVGIVV